MTENFTDQVEESQMIKVDLVWGLDDIDRTGDNAWDPEFVGKIIFDDTFSISSPVN